MNTVSNFLSDMIDFNMIALFFISAVMLIFLDAKKFEKEGLQREFKFSKFMGYIYAAIGVGLYIISRFIML